MLVAKDGYYLSFLEKQKRIVKILTLFYATIIKD